MADNINMLTYANQTILPVHDALINELAAGESGIIYGVSVTAEENTLHIGAGYGVICGRLFEIYESDMTVALSSGSSLQGRVYVHMDLSNTEEPISIMTETGSTLSNLQTDTNVNVTNGVYEIELATFTVSATAITNLTRTARMLHSGIKVITETDWYMSDIFDDGWYYFDHYHTPNDAPGTLVNGYLRVLSGGNSRKQILWRQGSETTQADTFVRTFTDGAWTTFRRLVCENEMYYMPGDQITLYGYGGGYMTSGKTMITFMVPTSKPFHSSVKGATYVETNDTVTIRQNNGYICDSVPLKNLTKTFGIRPNGLQINLSKSSGFGGTNNDGLGIAIRIVVKLT